MILSIAWKNIWRSKLRSSVVIFAITIGLVAGIFASAMMVGMLVDRVNSAINIEVSSVQLHNADFLENNEITKSITHVDEMMAEISSMPGVKSVSKRISLEAMVNSGHGPMGVKVMGVIPDEEMKVSQIYKHIADSNGTYFQEKGRNPIVIGRKLAEKLKVHLHSKIQIDVVNMEGIPTSSIFRVAGIYKIDNSMFEEMNVFVKFKDIQRLIDFNDDEAHEVAVLMDDIMATDSISHHLTNEYTHYKIDSAALLRIENLSIKPYIFTFLKSEISEKSYNEKEFSGILDKNINKEDQGSIADVLASCETGINVMTWKKLAPDLELTTQWMDLMLFIYVGIILLALGFGIINTMLMVVLERTRELGMLMAIGMNRRRVYTMVMIETIMLSLVGGIIGIGLSYLLVTLTGNVGINLTSMAEGFNAMGYGSVIYPSLDFDSYVQVVVMVLITGILSATYPAWKAIKLNPAEAIRSE